jgi:dTDP-4-amino-4,6-dideoxygalactose transaminase
MSIFKEIPPTAGFPLYLRDFLSLFSKQNQRGSLEEDFRSYLEVPYARVTNSGTAALYLILESLKELSSRRTVIIPAFVCPLVPLAIKRAGFNVKVCDINKDNFDFDIQKLADLCFKDNDILAIVAVHLAGIPIDFDRIKAVAQKKNGIFIIEDCAQSLGATYKGKKTGTLGEFSFFSLCRGKGLTIYEGGVIVANKSEYATVIDNKMKKLVKNNFLSEGLKILELFGYWIFYRPQLFWFVYRLPQLFWYWQGQDLCALTEYFNIDFPIHKVSGIRKLIGHVSFGRLEKEIEQQEQKAHDYIEAMEDIKGVKIITWSTEAKAIYPYLTLFFDEPTKRKKALRIFRNLGLGVSIIYAAAITDYDYLKEMLEAADCPNARYLAERQITLTTNTFLKKEDLNSVITTIKKL